MSPDRLKKKVRENLLVQLKRCRSFIFKINGEGEKTAAAAAAASCLFRVTCTAAPVPAAPTALCRVALALARDGSGLSSHEWFQWSRLGFGFSGNSQAEASKRGDGDRLQRLHD